MEGNSAAVEDATNTSFMCEHFMVCVCMWMDEDEEQERMLNAVLVSQCVHGFISPLLHVHALTDCEVIFNQSDSMCLGLNGLLQVNPSLY